MKNLIFQGKKAVYLSLLVALAASLVAGTGGIKPASAAVNLIANGSFETNIEDNWTMWRSEESDRSYELIRSYDAPFGYGSYSAGIEAFGSPEGRWLAGLATAGNFEISADRDYYLIFYAKATAQSNLSMYLQGAVSYEATTAIASRQVSTAWQKHMVLLSPSESGRQVLTFTFGDLADNATLYLDAVALFASDLELRTPEITGQIGEKNRYLAITNINLFSLDDIEIELPHNNSLIGRIGVKRFHPVSYNAGGVYFDMFEGTFPGVGKVYVNDVLIGQFDYNVRTVISEIHPVLARADHDLTIIGTGFNPMFDEEKTFLVLRSIDYTGKVFDSWVKPHTIDGKLTQITAKLPLGVVAGRLYVHTSYIDKSGAAKSIISNALNYSVMPVIFGSEWKSRGYDQVGDKIIIKGKGIGLNPIVRFYNENGVRVDSKAARLLEINDSEEIIEVPTSTTMNKVSITVEVNGVESDAAEALTYIAKAKITSLRSTHVRNIVNTSENIFAGKIGDEVMIYGQGFKDPEAPTYVEFQGLSGRIEVTVSPDNVAPNGTWVRTNIPFGAQNGTINVSVNGEKSNSLALEVVPTILEIAPDPLEPGKMMSIRAEGAGDKTELTKIYFKLDNTTEIAASPDSIEIDGSAVVINVRAPMAISNKSSNISLQYDKWRNTGASALSIEPTIYKAAINLDDKVLTIYGYGFSIIPSENKITYKYSDGTVITPNARIIGVYATEEGQEIRIQIHDRYHYGRVTVKIDEKDSNEASFGPVKVRRVARRVQYVESLGEIKGVLYINGYNFGDEGGVKIGEHWADIHYRNDFFIIAVIDEQHLYDNPVIVARE